MKKNMKKNIFYGIMLAVAFLLSSASFASPYSSNSVYTSPKYESFTLAVWPPTVPAIAMAADGVSDRADKPCMASCNIGIDDVLADWRQDAWSVYENSTITDNRTYQSVLACGYKSEQIYLPQNVPRSV